MKLTKSIERKIIHLFEFNNGELTQKEIAKKLNISTCTISKVLSNRFKPKHN